LTQSRASAAGPSSAWLICSGTPEGPGLPGVLYRTAGTSGRGSRESSLRLYAVSNRVAWAVQANPSGSNILRTTDGGRTWRRVLSRPNADVQALVPQGPDGAQAVVRVLSAGIWRFIAYRTRSAGNTWHHAALPA